MKICALDDLIRQNFNPVFINGLQQFWRATKSFQCIGTPKKQNLFVLLNGCSIMYTNKDGQVFEAHSGDVVYTPMGSEYRMQLSDFQNADSHTIGINFLLYDEQGEDMLLSDKIQIFHTSQNQMIPMLFRNVLHNDTPNQFIQNRILLMEILCALATKDSEKSRPDYITKALRYLSEHIEQTPTVAELAALCNISEVYFRKQFKACVGVSPCEYRNALRLSRAKSYLEYGEISVQEISHMLGYSTVSHFIKEFKQRYACSPLRYRKMKHID